MDMDLSKCDTPQLSSSCLPSALMMLAFMWTGMSGFEDHALPMNPGGVYKLPDTILKYKVWKRWGYGDVPVQ